jgi:hypothetical protein
LVVVVALVVAVVALVVAEAVIVLVVAVVMVQAHALNLALVVEALAVAIVQVAISKRARLDLLTHALHALLTHVQQVHVLLNQSLAVNVGTLAVAKNGSPKSSPFFMESSRFR